MDRVASSFPSSGLPIFAPHWGQKWLSEETSDRQWGHFTGTPPFLVRPFYTQFRP